MACNEICLPLPHALHAQCAHSKLWLIKAQKPKRNQFQAFIAENATATTTARTTTTTTNRLQLPMNKEISAIKYLGNFRIESLFDGNLSGSPRLVGKLEKPCNIQSHKSSSQQKHVRHVGYLPHVIVVLVLLLQTVQADTLNRLKYSVNL